MGESMARTNGGVPHGGTANGIANGTAGHRERLVVLAATEVGLYHFESDRTRAEWERRGPFLAPCDISHAAYDPRDGAIWAAANGEQSWVYRSEDLGETWRWQRLSTQGEVVTEASLGHGNYEACLTDATENGYVFEASQIKWAHARSR